MCVDFAWVALNQLHTPDCKVLGGKTFLEEDVAPVGNSKLKVLLPQGNGGLLKAVSVPANANLLKLLALLGIAGLQKALSMQGNEGLLKVFLQYIQRCCSSSSPQTAVHLLGPELADLLQGGRVVRPEVRHGALSAIYAAMTAAMQAEEVCCHVS